VVRHDLLVRVQIEKLQAVLSDEEACKFNFASFDAIPLPLDPEVRIRGIIPETASLFKVSYLKTTGKGFYRK